MSLAVGIGQGYRGEAGPPALGGAAAQPVDRAPRLGALAAHLPVLLDLPADVLGELVDRVGHLRRGLVGAEGDALEAQCRLRHLAVRYRRIRLLPDLDVERRQIRHLPADPAKSLEHLLPKIVVDLDVTPTYLDPHMSASFAWAPMLRLRRPLGKTLYGRRAK